jgi:hypothetical protein
MEERGALVAMAAARVGVEQRPLHRGSENCRDDGDGR